MGAFIVTESRSRSPLVPLGIFKRRTLTGANVIGFLLGASIFGIFFLLSLYMQQILGFSAIKTGVGYLALALTVVVASGIAQALVTRLGVKPVLATGMILIAAGQGYFTQISVNGSYFADLFPGFILLGVGMGFCFVPISIAALAGATSREAGLQSGLINTMQQIGGAVGLAILTTVGCAAPRRRPLGGNPQESFALAFSVRRSRYGTTGEGSREPHLPGPLSEISSSRPSRSASLRLHGAIMPSSTHVPVRCARLRGVCAFDQDAIDNKLSSRKASLTYRFSPLGGENRSARPWLRSWCLPQMTSKRALCRTPVIGSWSRNPKATVAMVRAFLDKYPACPINPNSKS